MSALACPSPMTADVHELQIAPSIMAELKEYPEELLILMRGEEVGVWVLTQGDSELHGLAAFQSRGEALRFSEKLPTGLATRPITFDGARALAKHKGLQAVFIMDGDWDHPRIHWVA